MKYNPPANYNNFATISQKEKKELLKIDALEYYIKKITASQLEKLTLLYEQELFYLDEKLLDLYLFIDKVGLKDQTLFIITADHGEMLGEHGLLGHYFGLYNELLHIPLIIKYPASVGQQGECGQLAQLHDLFATIMEITEVPIPVPESSKSLLSTTRNFVFAEHFNPWLGLEACQRRDPNFQPTPTMQPCRCIIDRHLHKLIEWADGRLEFYDLQNDYAEEANLISHSARATQAEQLQQKLQGTLGPFDVSQSLL
jgi:arylsulfatase A-like enzyme